MGLKEGLVSGWFAGPNTEKSEVINFNYPSLAELKKKKKKRKKVKVVKVPGTQAGPGGDLI